MNNDQNKPGVSPGGVFFKIPDEKDIQEQLMLQTGAEHMEIYSDGKFSMVGKLLYVGKGVWRIYASPRIWITFHKDDVLKVSGIAIKIKDRD